MEASGVKLTGTLQSHLVPFCLRMPTRRSRFEQKCFNIVSGKTRRLLIQTPALRAHRVHVAWWTPAMHAER